MEHYITAITFFYFLHLFDGIFQSVWLKGTLIWMNIQMKKQVQRYI